MEFSQRDVPWMKAGVDVIDQAVTAAEAAELGGLNFDVELWPLEAVNPSKDERIPVQDRFAVTRIDTGVALAVVGSKYNPLQFGEAFDFMDSISPRYVAAGVRRGGREGYMVVQAPDHLQVELLDGEDPHDLYVVLRTSHDGSKQIEASVLPLRNKCTNMLSLQGFSHGAKQKWGVRHTSTMPEKLAEAKLSLSNINIYVRDLKDTARTLAAIDVEIDEVRKLLEWVLPDRPKREDNIQEILGFYHSSETNGYAGTGWGVVNAITEWMDWGRKSKSADARFFAGLAGYGHKTVNRAAVRLMTQGR